MASSPASSALPMVAIAAPPPVQGMGFNFLPPFPIILRTFGFLKSLDFRIVALEMGIVMAEFGWDLMLFELTVEQTESETVSEPSEAPLVFEDFSESGEAKIGSDVVLEPSGALSGDETCPGPMCEGVSGLGEIKTGLGLVPDMGEAGTKPSLVLRADWMIPLIRLQTLTRMKGLTPLL